VKTGLLKAENKNKNKKILVWQTNEKEQHNESFKSDF